MTSMYPKLPEKQNKKIHTVIVMQRLSHCLVLRDQRFDPQQENNFNLFRGRIWMYW